MKTTGAQLEQFAGTAAAPGYVFGGWLNSGYFGLADGGLGTSVKTVEVGRYDGNGRRISREHEYLKAFQAITGGGILTYLNGCVKWTNRFIMIPVATAIEGGRFIEIIMPASGATIPVEGASARTVTADGIPIQSWETLFAIHVNGSAVSFYIGTYSSGTLVRDNYIPVCTQNADFGFVRFCTGVELYAGDSDLNRAGLKRQSSTSWALKYDDTSTAVLWSTARETRTVNISYVIDYKIANADTDNKNWRWNFGATTLGLECVNDAYNSASIAMNFVRSGVVVVQVQVCGTLLNIYDGLFNLGGSSNRWKDSFFVNQPTISSDRRYKYAIRDLNEAEIAAWGDVSPKAFRMLGPSGPGSDLHAGYIAQEVEDAFAKQGLDAFAYGLISKDAETGYLNLRYGECNMFEAAYQRAQVAVLKQQVAKLAAAIGITL